MPITISALKKLRQDKKRSNDNLLIKKQVKKVISEFKRNPTPSLFKKLVSFLDKAAKKRIFHANKASRLKSRLSKLLKNKNKTPSLSKPPAPQKKSPKKKKSVV